MRLECGTRSQDTAVLDELIHNFRRDFLIYLLANRKELEELQELGDHLNLFLEIQECKDNRVFSVEELPSELGLE